MKQKASKTELQNKAALMFVAAIDRNHMNLIQTK